MNDGLKVFASILTGIISAAIVAVILSRNSQTGNVITSFFSGFSSILRVAVSPVSGSSGGASPTGFSPASLGPGNTSWANPDLSYSLASVGGLFSPDGKIFG